MPALMRIPGGAPAAVVRATLRDSDTPEVRLRRAVIGASLIGMAAMGVVALFQGGLIRHLKDPPLKDFRSDAVNSSDTAYGWGIPDSPLSMAAHAASIALATLGAEDRSQRQPWVPLAASAAAAPAALTSAQYLFYEMPVREKGWCPYCIVDALAHIAVLGFTFWESKKALSRLAAR